MMTEKSCHYEVQIVNLKIYWEMFKDHEKSLSNPTNVTKIYEWID